MTLREQYRNAAPVGVYGMNNFGGLAILELDSSGESCIAAWSYGDGYTSTRRHTIRYTYTGRAYIRKNGRRFYFDQITRTNGGF